MRGEGLQAGSRHQHVGRLQTSDSPPHRGEFSEWSGRGGRTKDFLLIESLSDFVNIYDELQTGELGNVSSALLAFTPEKEDDGKFLSCRARNELIQNSAVEDQWQITVYCEYLPCPAGKEN